MKDWKAVVKYYSINLVFGNSLISYYNEKRDLIHCESGTEMDKELEKKLKRLYAKDLNYDNKNSKKRNIKIKGKKKLN